MEKGFKTLELIGDLDDKYIYEASGPWKKQHRFFHIQRSWKTVAAGVILLIMVGGTLRYLAEGGGSAVCSLSDDYRNL